MKKKYEIECPDMEWIQADLTTLQYPSENFSCVLDKGTLDALMTDDSQEVIQIVEKYFQVLYVF